MHTSSGCQSAANFHDFLSGFSIQSQTAAGQEASPPLGNIQI